MDSQIKRKKLLCVDFDGVLHSYMTPWAGPDIVADPPVPGAMKWLIEMAYSPEYQICIYSSRSRYRSGIMAMKAWISEWLRHTDVPADYPNDYAAHTADSLVYLSQKPAAYLTIDDRAICFNGTFPTIEEMDDFKPWFNKYAEPESEV